MIEYILIHDLNDQDEHAHELAKLLYSKRQYILLNLIPYNPTDVAESFEPPTEEQVKRFHNICTSDQYRIFTRIRQEMGQDIAGACGQLALVSPGNVSEKSSSVTDIEDVTNKKLKSVFMKQKSCGNDTMSKITDLSLCSWIGRVVLNWHKDSAHDHRKTVISTMNFNCFLASGVCIAVLGVSSYSMFMCLKRYQNCH